VTRPATQDEIADRDRDLQKHEYPSEIFRNARETVGLYSAQREANEIICRLVSCLKNARNILGSEGYLYAKEIDKLLAELKPQ
jgi:hypothetical protein